MKLTSKKLLYGGLIGIVSISLVFVIVFFVIYSSFVNQVSKIEYVSFKNEKVDTIYGVVGKRKVCSYIVNFQKNNEKYEIDYCNHLSTDDYIKYNVYLLGDGFVLTKDNIGNKWFVKESSDDNKIIGIYIDDINGKIVYQKTNGSLYNETINDNYL